jgi:hypothetical protein
MKRERPPMPPLAVRVQVAERQFAQRYPEGVPKKEGLRGGQWLAFLLMCIFDDDPPVVNLDHDPALILRKYNPRIKDVAARYTPHAHDPEYLIYREKADHQQKTTGRKPGADRTVTTKGSDIGLKAKFNRLEGRTKRRPKAKIPQRKNPWPKRKFR